MACLSRYLGMQSIFNACKERITKIGASYWTSTAALDLISSSGLFHLLPSSNHGAYTVNRSGLRSPGEKLKGFSIPFHILKWSLQIDYVHTQFYKHWCFNSLWRSQLLSLYYWRVINLASEFQDSGQVSETITMKCELTVKWSFSTGFVCNSSHALIIKCGYKSI